MKELSIEQKAKAYDEAVNRAKAMIKVAANQDEAMGFAETIFPELKKSEDERIRKAIIEHFSRGKEVEFPELEEKYNTWIAWLEKQGEQKPANKIEPMFNVGDKIQYSKGCGTIMTIEKIENGEYIFSNNKGHTTIESGNKWYLVNPVEQNPTWGEEDENMYRKLHNLIYAVPYCDSRKEFSDWLKSIKDKVQSQPKQEWGEEDEQILNAAILHIKNETYNYYGGYSSECIMRWLKSLKDRVVPQPKQ